MADTFTPEQIAQILEEFFKVVGTRQYIGARYVPLFGRKDEESIEWDNSAPYEPLTVVLYQGNSYTSRQFVPVGVEITNQEFWAITGNYNAQVEMYRRETAAAREIADNALTAANNAQIDINMLLPKADFSAENTVKKYVDDAVSIVQTDIDTLLPKADFSAENTVKKYVDNAIINSAEILPYELIGKITYQVRTATGQSMQGGLQIDNSYVIALRDSSTTTLNKFDTAGNVLASNTDSRLGHANDMTLDANGNIVLIGADYNILTINASTLAIMSTHAPEVSMFSIARDDDGTYYGLSDNNLYHLDSNFGIIDTFEHGMSYTFQGIAIKGDYIYCPVNATGKVVVLTKQGTYHGSISTNVGPDRTEPEFIYFKDEKLYIGIQTQDRFGYVLEFDYNAPDSLVSVSYNNATNSYASNYYIDADASTGLCDGTQNKPIGSLDMALAMKLGSVVNLYLKGTFTAHSYYIADIANVTVTRFDDSSNYTMNYLNLTNCPNASVQRGIITTLVVDSCSAYLAVNTVETLTIRRSTVDLSSYNTLTTINIANSVVGITPNQNLSGPTVSIEKSICRLVNPVSVSTDTDSTGKTYTCDYLPFFDKYIVGVRAQSGFQANVICQKIYGNRYTGSAISRPGSANWKMIVVDFNVEGNTITINNCVYQELSDLQSEKPVGMQTIDGLV